MKKNCYTNNRVFIIAELSANHNGSLEIAIESVKAAKRAGADAIKLQTYTADTITLNSDKPDFANKSRGTIWDSLTAYALYEKAHTPWEWHKIIFDEAQKNGIICFSSPFDKSSVDFLENLECPIYKIASPEITDIPLIEYAASKGKPMIISTGIANFEDIKLALDTCRRVGNHDIALLKCTSSYPAPIEEANMAMIPELAKRFDVISGLSDHTIGSTVPIVATALGARIIEKHFIIDKAIGGPDATFSMDEREFTEMVKAVRDAEKAIGIVSYELTPKQVLGRQFCRSLYVVKDIKKGEEITDEHVRSIRPGFGGHPKMLKNWIGMRSPRDFERGDRFNLLDKF